MILHFFANKFIARRSYMKKKNLFSIITSSIFYFLSNYLIAKIILYLMIPDYISKMSIQLPLRDFILLTSVYLFSSIVIQTSNLDDRVKIVFSKIVIDVAIGIYFLLSVSYVLTDTHFLIFSFLLLIKFFMNSRSIVTILKKGKCNVH